MKIERPRALADAEAMLRDGAIAIAGGTALQLDWAKGVARPAWLVDLGRIGELQQMGADGETWRIGAAVTLDRAASALPPGVIAETISCIAAAPVRRLGTVGGNVASGTGCLLPTLLALDATLQVFRDGELSDIGLLDWLALPATERGLLVAVRVAALPQGARAFMRKIGLRTAFTPSMIGVAGVIATDGEGRIATVRLAAGGGVVRPQRLSGVEDWLTGRRLPDDQAQGLDTLRQRLIDAIDAPSDAFRSARYRKRAGANALLAGLLGQGLGEPPRLQAAPSPGTVSREAMAASWRRRADVPAKVAGRLPFLTDFRESGMLIGRILRAGVPHAKIVSIDTSAAEALPGVAAVVTAADVRGLNGYGIVFQDQPALCADKVRYAGDAVAAVAAVDAETAERALKLIRVDYEALPLVDDPEQALRPGATLVHAGGNLVDEHGLIRGDVDAAWAKCAHIVEAVYATPRQMHAFLETEGGHARVEPDGTLFVAAGGQYGLRDRMQLSRLLDLPEEKIRVVTSPTGGAFGGKDELTVQPALALLALKSGRPVRMQLSRAESVLSGWKRNPMTIRMKTGCDADGRLIAQEVECIADCGAYASLSPAVLETAMEHCCGPYIVPNISTRGRLAYTNNGVCGAFRGFGANQMTFAIESQMGRLAEKVGIDPVAIRRLNLRTARTPGYLGQDVASTERMHEMLDAAIAAPAWQGRRLEAAGWRIGVGLALSYQGNGLGSKLPDPGGAVLSLLPDGRIEAAYGLDEMGQGVVSVIRAQVAKAVGCDPDDVVPVVGDTGRTPESGSTTASRGSYVAWKASTLAGPTLAAGLIAAAAARLHRPPEALALTAGGCREARSNSGDVLLSFRGLAAALPEDELPTASARFEFPKADWLDGNARFIFCFGATVARVAVDPISGMVRVLDLEQHTAAGPVLDVAGYLGQIEGGGVQGFGFTLTEDATMQGGQFVTTNLDSYMVPSLADAPDRVLVTADESLEDDDPHGPRGIGELGIASVAPAIAAAIADATGFWPTQAPFPPEMILDALEAAP